MSEWKTTKPKKNGEYLTTVKGLYEGEYYVKILNFGKPTLPDINVKGRHWYDWVSEYGDILYDDEVLAWQELPMPWKEG